MEKNEKYLKWGLLIIGFVCCLCLSFITLTKLDKPVFFKHYYEFGITNFNETENFNIQSGYSFKLQYITNRSDTKEVIGISFKEAPDLTFYVNENMNGGFNSSTTFLYNTTSNINRNLGKSYGRYCVRTIYVNIYPNSINKDIEEYHLSEAIINFSNGESMEANIGEIVLNRDISSERLMSHKASGSSNDGTSFEQYYIDKDIILLELHSSIIDDIESIEYVKVNGLNYSDIKNTPFPSGNIKVSSKVDYSPDDFTLFEIQPQLIYKDTEGKKYSERIYMYKNLDFISLKSIIKYLISRGKL